MHRIGKLLVILVLAPAPAVSQVGVARFDREDGRSLDSAIAALERSRDALLQARDAVDTALIEVDRALATVRAAAPRRSTGPWPAIALEPASAVPASGAPEKAPASKPARASLLAAAASARAGWLGSAARGVGVSIARRFGGWRPALDALRELSCSIACRLEKDPEAEAPAQPSSPRLQATDEVDVASRPVLAVARDGEVAAASHVKLAPSEPVQEALPPVQTAVAGLALEPPVSEGAESLSERKRDDASRVEPASAIDPALPEPRGPLLPAVESAVPPISTSDSRT